MFNQLLIQSPRLLKRFYSDKTTWEISSKEKIIYLSFDDGPVPRVTGPLLDILDHYGVKATFFCVGDNVYHHRPIYRDLLTRGHKTGNHTFHHLNGWKTSNKEYLDNVAQCRQLVDSKLFRPPYGKLKPSQIKVLAKNYHLIYWSVLSMDYDSKVSAENSLKICTDNLKPGNIFVFHDSIKAGNTMLEVVPKFIEKAALQGYSFDVIPDIKNKP